MPKNDGNSVENKKPVKPIRYEMSHVNSKVEAFEDYYGIKVSCKKFEKDLEKKLSNARNNGLEVDFSAIKKEVFFDTVKELYRQYIWKEYTNDKLSKDTFTEDLFDSFHEIIHMYSATDERANYFGEIFEIEMLEVEKCQVIYDGIKDMKPVDSVKSFYMNGDLSIRDMRAYAEELIPSEMKDEEIATALQLARALREVNEGRSFWWRVFHPIRNNAEQRDAKVIEDMMTNKILEMQAGQQHPKGLKWYSDFAQQYSPLSQEIQTFANDIQEALDDMSEVGDDAYLQEEEISLDGISVGDISEYMPFEEDKEVNFDNEVKEDAFERRSLNIELENEEMDVKSPFIDSKSMKDPVVNNFKK